MKLFEDPLVFFDLEESKILIESTELPGSVSSSSSSDLPSGSSSFSWLQEFKEKFARRRNLTFVNPEVHEEFQKRLLSKQSTRNVTTIILIYTFSSIAWGVRDFFFGEWFYPGMLYVALTLRVVVLAMMLGILGLGSIPATKSFFQKHFNGLAYGGFFLAGIIYSSFLAFYTTKNDTGFGAQACHCLLLFLSVRMRIRNQTIGVVFQLIFFVVLGVITGYELPAIASAVGFTLIFVMIGFVVMYSMEATLQSLFIQQEFSLHVMKRHVDTSSELLRQANAATEAKSRFLANMSHEIRTPLHGVITALELLKSTQVTREQSEYINVAEISSGLLLDILNNILTMSKLQAGMVVLEKVPVDLRSLLEGVTVVFSQMASKKGVEVISFIPSDCPVHVFSDPIRLKQMFFNLVSNAVKFTSSGHIAITAKQNFETNECVCVTFSVTDSGIGIAPENLHMLFQRFAQVDESNTRKFQGTGLGLALVFEFSKLFGGSVSVHSKGLGKGTTFHLSLTFEKKSNFPTSNSEIRNSISAPMISVSDLSEMKGNNSDQPIISLPLLPISSALPPLDLRQPAETISLFPDWVCPVLCKDPLLSDLWAQSLSQIGISAFVSQNPPNFDQLLSIIQSKIEDQSKSISPPPSPSGNFGESVKNNRVHCSPICIVIDQGVCADLPVLEFLKSVFDLVLKTTGKMRYERRPSSLVVDRSSFTARLICSFNQFPISILFLEEPLFGDSNSAQSPTAIPIRKFDPIKKLISEFHGRFSGPRDFVFCRTYSIKKPCRIGKLAETFDLVRSQIAQDFSKQVSKCERESTRLLRRKSVSATANSSRKSSKDSEDFCNDYTIHRNPQSDSAAENFASSHMPMVTFEFLENFKFGAPSGGSGSPDTNENSPDPQEDPIFEQRKSDELVFFQHGDGSQNPLPESSLLSALISGREPTTDQSPQNHQPPQISKNISPKQKIPTPKSKIEIESSGGGVSSGSGLSGSGSGTPTSMSKSFKMGSSNHDFSGGDHSIFKKVLIADDNVINRKLTERLLTRAGFTCVSVEDGSEAVEAIEKQRFALIFMDITMPILDGCSAAKIIRENQRSKGEPETLICALSAAIGEEGEQPVNFSPDLFDFSLPKPIKSDFLIQTANRLTALYQDHFTQHQAK